MAEARVPGGERRALVRVLLHARFTLEGITDAGMASRGDWARTGNHSVVRRNFAPPVIVRSEIPRSAGKQSPSRGNGDCFAALAMTISTTRDRVHTCAATRVFRESGDVVEASYKSLPVRIR